MSAATWGRRCAAAHLADPRPCEGQWDAVRVVDQTGAGTEACLLHGAVLLASLDRGRVYPLNGPDGSAIVVFTRAQGLPPFDFLTGPGVARVPTVDEAAVFPAGPEPEHRDDDLRPFCAGDDQNDDGLPAADGVLGSAECTGVPGPTSTDSRRWSHFTRPDPGNARSSCWSETSVSRLRGNA